MHGFPHAVKDLEPTAGLRTTLGLAAVPRTTCRVDDSLLGRADPVGRRDRDRQDHVPEWGLGLADLQPGVRPHPQCLRSRRRPAAARAAGPRWASLGAVMLPVADGSENMGGSLRNPAGFSNVFGLRPSRGRVPKWPADDCVLFSQLSTEGPMARTVARPRRAAGHAGRAPIRASRCRCPPIRRSHAAALVREPGHWRGRRIGWLGDLGGHLAYRTAGCCRFLRARAGATSRHSGVRGRGDAARLRSRSVVWRCFHDAARLGRLAGRFDAYRRDPALWSQLKPEAPVGSRAGA